MSPTIATIGSGFNGPSGVAVDGAGNVFVADIGNHAVKEVLAGTSTVITLSSAFSEPYYVKLDQAGNLYVSDDLGGTVTKFAAVDGSIPASPVITTFAGGFNGITGLAVPN
jgi:DNA-binding beta-propeller fold protein YncE